MPEETEQKTEVAPPLKTAVKAPEAEFVPAVPEDLEAQAEGKEPRAFAVRIKRIRAKDEEPLTCIPVSYKGEYRYFRPAHDKTVFDVDALTATAAIETGAFEVDPASKVQLKTGGE